MIDFLPMQEQEDSTTREEADRQMHICIARFFYGQRLVKRDASQLEDEHVVAVVEAVRAERERRGDKDFVRVWREKPTDIVDVMNAAFRQAQQ